MEINAGHKRQSWQMSFVSKRLTSCRAHEWILVFLSVSIAECSHLTEEEIEALGDISKMKQLEQLGGSQAVSIVCTALPSAQLQRAAGQPQFPSCMVTSQRRANEGAILQSSYYLTLPQFSTMLAPLSFCFIFLSYCISILFTLPILGA